MKRIESFSNYKVEFMGVNLLALSQIFVFELSLGRLEGKNGISRLKKYSLDNYAKALWALVSKKGEKADSTAKYLFVNDVNNPGMISNIRSVQKQWQQPYIEVITDKRIFADHSVFLFKYFSPFAFLHQLFRLLVVVRDLSGEIKGFCEEFRIQKRMLLLNLIDSVFVLVCAEGFMKAHPGIRQMVLNTDVHKIARALVFLGQKREIKTYVLQHGSTVLEYGYLPVNADYMLTWGKISKDWFLERGTDAEKLITIGTPKMDGTIAFECNEEPHEPVQNVLLILNPVGDQQVYNVLKIVQEAGVHADYNLRVKLHPGSVDNREQVSSVFRELDVEVYKLENTHELIRRSDVIITTTSTVGNEAIALCKPLVQVGLPDITASMAYENYGCSHVVRNSEELRDLLSDPIRMYAKKTLYTQYIKDYFYILNGKAALRIKDFVG